MEAVGEPLDQFAEHQRAGREAVQQQQGRGVRVAGLAVEDAQAVGFDVTVVDRERGGGHGQVS
ncbi:hypothetical protein D3C71_1978510 [compost metagenome]